MVYMNDKEKLKNQEDFIWLNLIKCKNNLIDILKEHCIEYQEPGMEQFNKPGWTNLTFKNPGIRRAHIDVVDARETRGLWMLHLCVFPSLSNPGPIYGFDIIAGKKKVTGAFHDFSPLLLKDHPLTEWFIENTKWYEPSKKRDLPDWAMAIFSKGMVAAGNVQDEEELHDITAMAEHNLDYYLKNINEYHGTADEKDVIKAQNYYCEHQQKNPHTPKVMERLGLPEKDIKLFCRDNLFPTI